MRQPLVQLPADCNLALGLRVPHDGDVVDAKQGVQAYGYEHILEHGVGAAQRRRGGCDRVVGAGRGEVAGARAALTEGAPGTEQGVAKDERMSAKGADLQVRELLRQRAVEGGARDGQCELEASVLVELAVRGHGGRPVRGRARHFHARKRQKIRVVGKLHRGVQQQRIDVQVEEGAGRGDAEEVRGAVVVLERAVRLQGGTREVRAGHSASCKSCACRAQRAQSRRHRRTGVDVDSQNVFHAPAAAEAGGAAARRLGGTQRCCRPTQAW